MDKSKWYRIPEREAIKTTTDRSMIGMIGIVTRKVERVGYYFTPLDFHDTSPELISEAKSIMMSILGMKPTISSEINAIVEKYNGTLNPKLDYFLEKFHVPTQIKYRARKQLMNAAYKTHPEIPSKQRCIWYVDYLHPIQVKITGTKSCWTGKYFAPSGGWDSYSGEYDYDPGGLNNAVHHNLYTIESLSNIGSDQGELIHPADFILDGKREFKEREINILTDLGW